jgi:hypothetical protein
MNIDFDKSVRLALYADRKNFVTYLFFGVYHLCIYRNNQRISNEISYKAADRGSYEAIYTESLTKIRQLNNPFDYDYDVLAVISYDF